ncbi:MAG: hypothetical protein IJN32_06410, partial [Thermoguttaceae bacterium]|nr:hypothetical protein [Thermoguttaceae bacterium]
NERRALKFRLALAQIEKLSKIVKIGETREPLALLFDANARPTLRRFHFVEAASQRRPLLTFKAAPAR